MLRTFVLIVFLSSAGALNSFANDSDRIDVLEKEVQELKVRITKLEAQSGNPSSQQEALPPGEGWKSIANWRKLEKGMSASQVKKLLGEPRRVRSGISTTWEYQNDGRVEFLGEELVFWQEPNQ